MTYCAALNLKDGLVFASDSRTNAGVDHIATFRKMHLFQQPDERAIVLLNSGNLATTQSVISLLRTRTGHDGEHLLNVASLYDAARLVGETVREVVDRDTGQQASNIDFGCSFLVGGQIRGERPRLFNVYPQGNFIESSTDTPFFQIGESKYGKPILDRVIRHDTSMNEALKCLLISFDSTIRSNLSVGLPMETLRYRTDSFAELVPHRIDEGDEYFQQLRGRWASGLRQVFASLPDPDWFDED